MTTRQRTPASGEGTDALLGHLRALQLATSVDDVVAIAREALSGLAGIGGGMVWLGASELRPVAEIRGPGPDVGVVPAGELAALARRAVREKRPVRERAAGGLRWAAPLGTTETVHGVVAAAGDNASVPDVLAAVGPALARECGRGGASARERSLERAVEALDAIVRDGRTDNSLRRVTTGFACIDGLGKASLWELRAEDGRYVEVARSRNGSDGGFPALPLEARRAAAAREWQDGLPCSGDVAWVPAGDGVSSRPEAGDVLVLPLAAGDAPHAPGFLLAHVNAPLDPSGMHDELERWSALAQLALVSVGERGASLSGLEELRHERFHVAELHRLKSQFIAAVSHELRTPLTSISAYAETLRQRDVVEDPETRERFLRVIHEESRRLARIVDDILDIATMDSGRVRLSCRRVDLGQVVLDAFDVIHPIAGRKGIRIVPPAGEPSPVHADPDLLKQLVVNLMENAVKFTPEGGEVRVRVETEASAVRLYVEDNGPGIPEDELDAVFERFYQVDGTDSREHGGSGLGLAICRSIVTWHDGRIWAESAPGRGATLVVSLPRLRAVSRVRTEAVEEATARQDEHRVPELMIEMIAEIIGAETVSLMLLDEDGGSLYIQAAMGLPDEAIREVRVALGESISGRVAAHGDPILIPDIESDGRFPGRRGEQYRTRSLLCVPVLLRDRTIGVINVTNRTTGEPFTDHDRRLVAMLARRVALVMQKLREYGDRREAIARMEEAIQGVIDARRHYFTSRDGNTQLVVAVCEELGLDPDETTRIHYASFLRDVGMVRLPEGVYRKPGHLTVQDRERIRKHPEEGARSIRPIELESGVFEVILAHHEEADGTGYPRGLSGAGIPWGARVLAVVDAYDALRTGRPYKPAVTVTEAVAELRANAGSQFDRDVVDALVRVLEKRGDLRQEQP